ncbi:transglutaminase-like putative cysteine protease [Bradyrhizobium elkanii]
MRLRIAHTTTYRYEPAASGVIQILRMTPGSHDGQYVADWQIDVSTDSRLDTHEDAFGNVTHVLTHGSISDLTIHCEGLIETQDTGGVLKGTDERFPPNLFLRATPLTDLNPAMTAVVRELRTEAGGDVLGFLHALMAQIYEHMTFDEDPTNSATSAAEAFALKRGVCQDYAHILIACARAGGVPARFVSGHFLRSDGMVNQQAGHAWAEAFVPDLGWVGFDAANGICTTDAHARVAIGLDYLGAAPVRGTRYGGGNETLTVAVKVDQAGPPRTVAEPPDAVVGLIPLRVCHCEPTGRANARPMTGSAKQSI